ncbi:MAG: c-type cytochrome, partial [Verrucomicrobia bacterium]|nr:c-type cytochrome [Verrucomicrobiota bacterium]
MQHRSFTATNRWLRPLTVPLAIATCLIAGIGATAPAETNNAARAGDAASMPFGLTNRIAWDPSALAASPEPPLPYTVERTFTNLTWKAPIYLADEPGTERLLVVQAGGESDRPSRVLRFHDDPLTSRADMLLEIQRRLVYSVCFHPGYRTNGFLFVFSNGPTGASARTNRISRFTVERTQGAPIVSDSERIILEWPSSGHDGGDMVFGRDGMFYVTSGDGSSDSDTLNSGQTLDDLLGGVLRIDVDRADGTRLYAVPSDNPFVNRPEARPEIWAYGLRNPWRMGVDLQTGQIWVGNNGQDLWETAHLIGRGENYGWSVFEGSHPFYAGRLRGPTPHVPPTIEHSHAEFRSLTGGVVYRGTAFPELDGAYIYGDYSTGRIWGMNHDGQRVRWHRELADTSLQIAAFRTGRRGELWIVDHGGGIYRLTKQAEATRNGSARPFPTRLSETGLFVSTAEHRVDPALIPYSVNAPAWMDGAVAERFMAVPGDLKVSFESSRSWSFPEGSALVQTLSLEADRGKPASRFRVETRVMVRRQGEWEGYSYRWNSQQTDAVLVAKEGADLQLNREFASRFAKDDARVDWRIPSRAECMTCHSRQANFVLGISGAQLNRSHDYADVRDHQLRALDHIGLFQTRLSQRPDELPRLADPYDATAKLEARARAYLHVNCSVCHAQSGGGNAMMELAYTTDLERMSLIAARPQHDTFGLTNAMLVAPGDPARSVLLHRLRQRGRGQMPPLVSRRVDDVAVRLVHDWIQAMPGPSAVMREWRLEDFLPLPTFPTVRPSTEPGKQGVEERALASGKAAFRDAGCIQCHRFAAEGGTVGPDLTAVGKRLGPRELLEAILEPSKSIPDAYAAHELELADGEVLTGRIEQEDGRTLVLSPLVFGEASREVKLNNVRGRRRLPVSAMPAGMVNGLAREQVLDLVAYLSGPDGLAAGPGATETAAVVPGVAVAKNVAGLTTVYRHNSHADVILSRLLLTDRLDGTGQDSPLKLVSLYTDQRPGNDISRLLAASHRFAIKSNIADALTLGTGALAVEGVFLVAEHGDYPRSPTGNTQYPKRRFWDATLDVFRRSGRVAPVFLDKHLADNWADAKFIYDSARELNIPLMAGSSVPGSWRHPAADVERGGSLSEIVVLTF